ncbi:F-box/kelch-repeat protein At3g18720-like [Rosa chinensis]|uniref:F-box/kelch-repeat protein At3g18720-like n=1 Tax=Rosa chinensis TaxID=74649 RepID=UPI000D09482F|nr:F-box/kelch-repeat protein At3g18720-like [Rosa chinensis]
MTAINGQSRKKNNMSNGQSRKKQKKINGHSRKKTSKINGQSRCSWQTLPDDIMEYILQRLSLWDRIQLRMVSKSWRSVAMRRDIRSSPTEIPWLLLPPSESPNLSNNNYISFFSLSDAKVHKLTLPRAFGGGWVHGSSKGWLVMVKGAYSKMFLLNPISGAQQELPSLKTVFPYFAILKELKAELEGTHVLDNLCNQVVLSTSDIYSDDCIVAAIFRDHILALCKPGDKRWRKVLDFKESDRLKLSAILFSCGMLYC